MTAVPRTLLDLAAKMRTRDVERTLERAERLGLLDLPAIDSVLRRSGGHAGRERLRSALVIYRDFAFTRARSERLFMAIIKAAGLPRPAMNTFVAGYELDAYWPALRFAVEIDGFESHGTRAAFERDPVRVEDLKLAGIDAIRITAKRIEDEPDQVGKRLRALLAQRAAELRRT